MLHLKNGFEMRQVFKMPSFKPHCVTLFGIEALSLT